MDNRQIDYEVLLSNIKGMIQLLEFDSMRSAGKAKLNAITLESLYSLADRYGQHQVAKPKDKPAEPKSKKGSAKTDEK